MKDIYTKNHSSRSLDHRVKPKTVWRKPSWALWPASHTAQNCTLPAKRNSEPEDQLIRPQTFTPLPCCPAFSFQGWMTVPHLSSRKREGWCVRPTRSQCVWSRHYSTVCPRIGAGYLAVAFSRSFSPFFVFRLFVWRAETEGKFNELSVSVVSIGQSRGRDLTQTRTRTRIVSSTHDRTRVFFYPSFQHFIYTGGAFYPGLTLSYICSRVFYLFSFFAPCLASGDKGKIHF